jgi:subtilisin family serine protease
MDSEGYLREDGCINALAQILDLVERFHRKQPNGRRIDVLCLCFGYYLEDIAPRYDSTILGIVNDLGAHGVVVVASAGNHATIRPMYPAAFTPRPNGPVAKPLRGSAPVVGVGALNPDGTVALFSNSGPSVSAWAPGVNVASTFPMVDAGWGASGTVDPTGPPRRDLDGDNFMSGFALWSGTSMAAPVIAARIAQAMLDQLRPRFDDTSDAVAVERAWNAIQSTKGVSPWLRRPKP